MQVGSREAWLCRDKGSQELPRGRDDFRMRSLRQLLQLKVCRPRCPAWRPSQDEPWSPSSQPQPHHYSRSHATICLDTVWSGTSKALESWTLGCSLVPPALAWPLLLNPASPGLAAAPGPARLTGESFCPGALQCSAVGTPPRSLVPTSTLHREGPQPLAPGTPSLCHVCTVVLPGACENELCLQALGSVLWPCTLSQGDCFYPRGESMAFSWNTPHYGVRDGIRASTCCLP